MRAPWLGRGRRKSPLTPLVKAKHVEVLEIAKSGGRYRLKVRADGWEYTLSIAAEDELAAYQYFHNFVTRHRDKLEGENPNTGLFDLGNFFKK